MKFKQIFNNKKIFYINSRLKSQVFRTIFQNYMAYDCDKHDQHENMEQTRFHHHIAKSKLIF